MSETLSESADEAKPEGVWLVEDRTDGTLFAVYPSDEELEARRSLDLDHDLFVTFAPFGRTER